MHTLVRKCWNIYHIIKYVLRGHIILRLPLKKAMPKHFALCFLLLLCDINGRTIKSSPKEIYSAYTIE